MTAKSVCAVIPAAQSGQKDRGKGMILPYVHMALLACAVSFLERELS